MRIMMLCVMLMCIVDVGHATSADEYVGDWLFLSDSNACIGDTIAIASPEDVFSVYLLFDGFEALYSFPSRIVLTLTSICEFKLVDVEGLHGEVQYSIPEGMGFTNSKVVSINFTGCVPMVGNGLFPLCELSVQFRGAATGAVVYLGPSFWTSWEALYSEWSNECSDVAVEYLSELGAVFIRIGQNVGVGEATMSDIKRLFH